MSFKAELAQVWINQTLVAFRRAANYQIATVNIFTVVGGAIWIKALFCRFTLAAGEASGSTFAITAAGIAMQNAAVNCNGALNSIATWPLGAAAGQVIVPALLSQPPYSLANALLGQVGQGQICSVGNIALTVAGFITDGLPEFSLVYQRMSPASSVTVP